MVSAAELRPQLAPDECRLEHALQGALRHLDIMLILGWRAREATEAVRVMVLQSERGRERRMEGGRADKRARDRGKESFGEGGRWREKERERERETDGELWTGRAMERARERERERQTDRQSNADTWDSDIMSRIVPTTRVRHHRN